MVSVTLVIIILEVNFIVVFTGTTTSYVRPVSGALPGMILAPCPDILSANSVNVNSLLQDIFITNHSVSNKKKL